jgi:hypothetical protein
LRGRCRRQPTDGGGASKRKTNRIENFRASNQSVLIGETENRESLLFQKRIFLAVTQNLPFFGVNRTIDFYNQPKLQTDKINDVVTNRKLSAKVRAIRAFQFIPQTIPKPLLWLSHGSA